MANSGIFIVLEGADGSGKGTQFRLLSARLRAMGYEVAVFDFPRYQEPSSHFIKRYLNGEYGPATSINPYTASLFYALDRYEAAPAIRQALAEGKIVLSNRFVGSNMAHQGAKFTDPIEQRGFFVWEDNLEFELLNVPRPSLNIFLRVPAEISFGLISKKAERSYTKKSHDEHEIDLDYLKRSVATYDMLCKLFPKDFKAIQCVENDKLLSIPQINDLIWTSIKPMLPLNPPNPARGITVNLSGEVEEAKAPVKQELAKKSANQVDNSLNYTFDKLSKLAKMELLAAGAKLKVSEKSWAKKKDDNYYVPAGLSRAHKAEYREGMTRLLQLYSKISSKLDKTVRASKLSEQEADYLLKLITPMAAETSGSVAFNEEAYLEISAKTHVSADELSSLLRDLNNRASKLWQKPAGNNLSKKDLLAIEQAAHDLSSNLSAEPEEVQVLQAWPRQEFELLADALYSHSNLAREEIALGTANWPYQRKAQTLQLALKDPASNILGQVKYRIDALIDHVVLCDLINAGVLDDLQVQAATPRYGYKVPKSAETAEIEDDFMECFDESLSIYSKLQNSSAGDKAAYATLMGHKTRAQFTVSAQGIKKALSEDKTATTDFLDLLKQKVSEHHAIISESLVSTKTEQATPKKSGRKRGRRSNRSKKS